MKRIAYDWDVWARDDQLAPEAFATGGPWRTWLFIGGRGAGKTRAGAEWVRKRVAAAAASHGRGPVRIALVGETIEVARSVMVEGVSGLLAVHPCAERPKFEVSKRRLVWPSGSIAELYSAEDPDKLRGPQFQFAWCDEVCKWRHARETWDMLQFGLRLGDRPQQMVTTTPRSMALLKALLTDRTNTVVTRARTDDNAENLAPGFIEMIRERYTGSALGRQELDGELIEDREDALWRRAWFDQHRVACAPDLERIVVAVDPPVTGHARSDACGIMVAGLGVDGRAYVIGDETRSAVSPEVWAAHVAQVYESNAADVVVVEVNQGGDLVESVLRQVAPMLPVRKVRATRGKWVRAEPVAAAYARGMISHVGLLAELEDQMCDFGPDGLAGGRSPDRLDALVWAMTALLLDKAGRPRMRRI